MNLPPPVSHIADLDATGVGLEITLTKALSPKKDVSITIPYRDADVVGMEESRLVIARYDPSRTAWLPLDSTPDPPNNKVAAITRHFSSFQIMQLNPASTLDRVTVGPSRLRPSRNPSEVFTFRNLSAGASVRVYTLSMELVHETHADGTGIAIWNGRSQGSRQAASGVYYVLIEASGERKKLKILIER